MQDIHNLSKLVQMSFGLNLNSGMMLTTRDVSRKERNRYIEIPI